jgi:hypothetical protein
VTLLSRIARLSSSQRALLLRSLGALVRVRLALLVMPFAALHRRIDAEVRDAPADFAMREAAWAVAAVARRIPGTHCLARSLALHSLLRRSGFRSELHLGVAQAGRDRIAAHAWVECDGEAIEGSPGPGGHASFGRLPS